MTKPSVKTHALNTIGTGVAAEMRHLLMRGAVSWESVEDDFDGAAFQAFIIWLGHGPPGAPLPPLPAILELFELAFNLRFSSFETLVEADKASLRKIAYEYVFGRGAS
jgi:hypothetical protein